MSGAYVCVCMCVYVFFSARNADMQNPNLSLLHQSSWKTTFSHIRRIGLWSSRVVLEVLRESGVGR